MSMLLALAVAAGNCLPTDDLAVEAMNNFGACVVAQTPQAACEILALDYWTPAYDKKMRVVAKGHSRCAPGAEIRFNHLLFAGALAEALVKLDLASNELPQKLAYDPTREPIAARSPTEEMALCTALNAPHATAAVLGTEPASAEELHAMRPLGSVLSECLKKGAKVALNRPALRSVLAIAAYRIVSTPMKPTE